MGILESALSEPSTKAQRIQPLLPRLSHWTVLGDRVSKGRGKPSALLTHRGRALPCRD